MFTGDYPAHDTWLQSRENNKQHGKVATDLMKKYFPDSTILPNIGNHEAWPCNRCVYDLQGWTVSSIKCIYQLKEI